MVSSLLFQTLGSLCTLLVLAGLTLIALMALRNLIMELLKPPRPPLISGRGLIPGCMRVTTPTVSRSGAHAIRGLRARFSSAVSSRPILTAELSLVFLALRLEQACLRAEERLRRYLSSA
jgi:hypothetical protein